MLSTPAILISSLAIYGIPILGREEASFALAQIYPEAHLALFLSAPAFFLLALLNAAVVVAERWIPDLKPLSAPSARVLLFQVLHSLAIFSYPYWNEPSASRLVVGIIGPLLFVIWVVLPCLKLIGNQNVAAPGGAGIIR